MALREFSTDDGQQWRVWDVTPEKMHPTTRTEDYLSPYLEGWLVFESADGRAKRRLHPIPRGWSEGDDETLAAMLQAAEPIRGERTSGPQGRAAIEEAEAERLGIRQGGTGTGARTFRFPDGRYWSVAEWSAAVPGAPGITRTMLRFSAGARTLDLADWPREWRSFGDAQLADLLVRSFPREGGPNPTPHRRRAGDKGFDPGEAPRP